MMSQKTELRLAIKERLQRMSDHDREVESRVICKELRKILSSTSGVLAAYMPYADEPNIVPLLHEWLAAGKTLAMPAAAKNKLVFRKVTTLKQMHRNPTTNILEAMDDCEQIDDATIDLAIVPGRAFSRDCRRMGRGNGGYDKWIGAQRMHNAKTTYVGVCFECQLLTEIPMESHDQNVDSVVTARGVFDRRS